MTTKKTYSEVIDFINVSMPYMKKQKETFLHRAIAKIERKIRKLMDEYNKAEK